LTRSAEHLILLSADGWVAENGTRERAIQSVTPRGDVIGGPAVRAGRSLDLAGATIKARYRIDALASVSRDVVVYTAEDVRYGRPITLKVLREEVADDTDFVAAVRAQASTLAMFAHLHRGVARVYECDVTDSGELFVAVERTRGVTLREMLDARGALDPALALRVATRIGEALEALHHNRIIHGQLTPDAVVMVPTAGGTEDVRLVGVELTAAYRTPMGLRLCDAVDLAYRAPEQTERGETTEAADVYALGVLLREMLTPRGARQTTGASAAMPVTPPAIERIIATALDARSELRYPDISVMLNDMWGAHTVLVERESRPRFTGRQAHSHRRRRPRRAHSALRIATAVVMAGVFAAVVWVATDRIVSRSRAATAPDNAPVTVDSSATPPPLRPPPTEPASAPSSERAAGARTPTVEKPAAPVVKQPPTPAVERKERVPIPVASEPPRRAVEAPASAERPTTTPPRGAETEDGSSAIDWLFKNR
jgi:serine/threonine-protein kinase